MHIRYHFLADLHITLHHKIRVAIMGLTGRCDSHTGQEKNCEIQLPSTWASTFQFSVAPTKISLAQFAFFVAILNLPRALLLVPDFYFLHIIQYMAASMEIGGQNVSKVCLDFKLINAFNSLFCSSYSLKFLNCF